MRRRHHCRSCGALVCYQCSDQKVLVESIGKPSRVCDECFAMSEKKRKAKERKARRRREVEIGRGVRLISSNDAGELASTVDDAFVAREDAL